MKKKVIISILLSLGLTVIGAACTQNESSNSLSDDTSSDKPSGEITNLVNALVGVKDGDKLTLDAGATYDLCQDTFFHLTGYYASNTANVEENPNGERYAGVYLRGKKNVIIDGNGATLLVHGQMTPILLDSCENVTLKNFTVDYAVPTMTEFTVLSNENGTVELEILEDCLFEIEGSDLIFHGEKGKDGEYYWQRSYRDGNVLSMLYKVDTQEYSFLSQMPEFESLEKTGDNTVRAILKDKSAYLPAGYVVQSRNVTRYQLGGLIESCKNVVMEDVTVRAMDGFGILAQTSEDVTYRSVTVLPKDGRTVASNADIFHFSGCRGQLTVENCQIGGAHDDYINVHGTYLEIVKKISATTIVVRFPHAYSWGFNAFNVGDEVDFVRNGLLPYASATVKAVKRVNDTDIQIAFSQAVEVAVGDYVENASATPNLTVRGNLFAPSAGRGILVSTRGKVLIENNTFEKTMGSVLVVAGDHNFWYESGYTTDVTFRNNTINGCCYREKTPVISVEPQSSGEYSHKFLTVTNNTFAGMQNDSYTFALKNIFKVISYNNTTDKELYYQKENVGRLITNTDEPFVLLTVGDSITYGSYPGEWPYDNWGVVHPNFSDLLEEMLGATTMENYGMPGTSISSTASVLSESALTKRCGDLVGGNIVIIAMGTNDYGCGVRLGKKTDQTDTSFYGGAYSAFTTIQKNNPEAEIYVVLPIDRSDMLINSLGLTLDSYRNALQYEAELFGFHVIDGRNYPVHPSNPADKEQYMTDGVHPNHAGHVIYANFLYKEITGKDYVPPEKPDPEVKGPFTVTFDTGNVFANEIASQTLEYKHCAVQPNIPVAPVGYIFRGWKNGETTYDFSMPVTSDLALVAYYEAESGSTISSFHAGQGTILLSGEELMRELDDGNDYFEFTVVSSAMSSSDGLYLQIGARHIFLGEDGALIFSLKSDWQYDYQAIPEDACTVYMDDKVVNDVVKTVSYGTISGSYANALTGNTVYRIVFNLNCRAWDNAMMNSSYESEYGNTYRDLPTAGVYLCPMGNAKVFIDNYKAFHDESKDPTITVDHEAVFIGVNNSVTVTAKVADRVEKKTVVWTSLDEKIATVKDGVITGVSDGKTVVTAKNSIGDIANVVVTVSDRVKLNDTLYLALSEKLGDEKTSILATFTPNEPYLCDYMYVPYEDLRVGYNAIEFTVTVKKTGGYLFIVDGSNTNISTAWGGDGGYEVGTVIGPDYHGAFHGAGNSANYYTTNNTILKIKDEATGEDLSEKCITWTAGKTYRITYRLTVGHALSFFYTSSIYDTKQNNGAICWGRWNSHEYCYDIPSSLTFENFYGVNMEGKINMARNDTFQVEGYNAYVLIPADANGKWLWKTEFFYAFDKAEQNMYNDGYTRVYFEISDKYGSPDAVRLMYKFYQELMRRYDLEEKGALIGFSRGGLYAFNFALAHPECVSMVYLDAPVLDLRSWPRTDPSFNEVWLHDQVMKEYGFTTETEFLNYNAYPVGKLAEYFALGIPTLLVAGEADRTVAFSDNSKVMIDFCFEHNIPLTYYVKVGADHHPHSFGNVGGIDMYGEPYPTTFKVYSSEYAGTNPDKLVELPSDASIVTEYLKEHV